MRVYTTPAELRSARAEMTGTVGFVPTMGALHAGHLALVRRAVAETDRVIVSIFVNPTQFASDEETNRYPRTLERDLELLAAEGELVVFTPASAELYPQKFSTSIDVGELALPLEGTARPGHFRGVATIVAKLLNITQPDRAYFGQKDAQQLLVIRRMVLDLNLPVQIVAVPTVRDPDGVALSSRNALLSQQERRAARCLYLALKAAQDLWDAGEHDPDVLRGAMVAEINLEPLATLDYASIANPETLTECAGSIHESALASLAVRIGHVRLIDNAVLGRGAHRLP